VDAARLEEKYNRELEEMTDEIQAGIASGKYSLNDFQRALGEKTREAAEATDTLVRENPWAALGIAAAAGCLLGYLLSRD
jgi:ElaB protein